MEGRWREAENRGHGAEERSAQMKERQVEEERQSRDVEGQ